MANYYVTRNSDGSWNAKKQSANRASSISETQYQAERDAKEFSSNSGGGEVRIQDRHGKFRDSDTVAPANDPNPPKDTRH